MKKFAWGLAVLAAAGIVISAPHRAEARPKYNGQFQELYKIEEAKEKKCGVCHGDGGKNKKELSDYAKELKAALGEKNVMEEDAIKKAFKEVESKKEGDKTYGDILKAGKLPAPAK